MTSVGMSVKIAPAAALDAAATAVPQPGAEADAFAQLLAVVGTPAETSAPATATLPAAALLAGLAAIRIPGEGEAAPAEAVAAEAAPDEAQQASCMIEIADLAAKMLVAIKRTGRRDEEPGTDTPKGEESEGEAPAANPDGEPVAAPIAPPIILVPMAAAAPQPAAAPVQPVAEAKAQIPAVQVAAAAVLPKAATGDQPAADTADAEVAVSVDADAQPEVAVRADGKPAEVLPAPLRAAIQTLLADKAPALARPETPSAPAAAPAADQPAAAPLPVAAPTSGSVIAMMQSQLAAVAAPAEPAPVAEAEVAAPASPELAIERELDMARDNEWLDSLARDIASTTGRDSTLRFRLHPQSLGTLQVEVAQSQAGTSVRLTADTEAARAIIADAQPRLLAEARAQGVRIAETHVGMELGSHHASDQRRQGENRQETILRTAGGEAETHNEETTRTADGTAERFA